MEAAEAHLLNFSVPFDCSLLDQIVAIAMDGKHPQRGAANDFLVRMKENPNMWRRSDAILETSNQLASKFFGLQVLGEAINTNWKLIPYDQREGIRNYIVNKIISISNSEELSRQNMDLLPRLNLVLVQILKQDWPHSWPTFISDIVNSSKTSESLCENNMKVLKLLSEEVFDYSKDSMTTLKIKTLKESLNDEFSRIFHLCEFILEASTKEGLLLSTLQTLQRFLTWIPLGYIFETSIIPGLLSKFFTHNTFRAVTVDCLTEIACLSPSDIPDSYKPNMQNLLVNLIDNLSVIIPRDRNLCAMYANGSEEFRLFISRLAYFMGNYLKSYLPFFDQPDGVISHEATVTESLYYMIRISEVDDDEIFKTCLDFWNHFAKELYCADILLKSSSAAGLQSSGQVGFGQSNGQFQNNGYGGAGQFRPKHVIFDSILHSLRILMIDHMAKPEEVIIVEDDNGEIIREMTKDTDVIAQYKLMRESIVYLTNLNYEDTEAIMLEKLDLQVAGGMFSWKGLNTLCWAIGSISGAMGELDEKRFLVSVIKDLLRLCEEQRGKDNKAVVASNIMYIVGQYPRFLRAHWKFLKTVVNKLFEFMHEHHPGVQDMACDTFLKIAQKCKRKFMTPQVEDPKPFILTLICDLDKHITDLQPHQVQSFYESVGTMLSDQGPIIRLKRNEVMLLLMKSLNDQWKNLMAQGVNDIEGLLQPEVVKDISRILRINARVCTASGSIFIHQLSNFFSDVLNIYRLYSERVTKACNEQGPVATRLFLFKAMRGVKSEILVLFTSYIEVCHEFEDERHAFITSFMPSIVREVLQDFHSSLPAARDAKILTLFSSAIATFKNLMSPEIPLIMDAIFEKTLEMITANMLDFPEHRIGFFKFLHEANQYCFYGLFSITSERQKLVIDSIMWAIKHTERNISETGLEILLSLLQNIANNPEISQPFYVSFMVPLIQDVFIAMTDRLHKSGFKLQATILKHLFHLVQSGQVVVSLHPNIDNAMYLREFVTDLLCKAFPNLTKTQMMHFNDGLFDPTYDLNAFKQHLRDFLVVIKEFECEDNSELYIEETLAQRALEEQEHMDYFASVPGMLKPSEIREHDDPNLC
jgi:exportin-1